MHSFPLKNPKPDYEELLSVLAGKNTQKKVHFVEMLVDEEIKKYIIESCFGEKNYPPTVTFGGSANGTAAVSVEQEQTRELSQRYYRQLIDFYYKMGYSVVADYEFLVNFQAFNTVARIGEDPETCDLSRKQRHWAQEGRGVIQSWEEFERFPWQEVEQLVERYGEHLEFLGSILPEGMTIAVVGSVLEQVMEWLLGYEGVLYNVYDDPGFLGAAFEKVGKIVLELYEVAAPMECVGVIWHGDDIGFQTATMLSPSHLRRWVFPWFKRYAALAHSYKKPVWYHACGNKDQVMEDFIEDIGFDAIHSFEDSSNPVTEYKERFGDRMALLGGVDIDKLARMGEDDLREYVRKILDICMPGGRYALGSGNSVCNFIPVKNYLIMLDEGLNYS
jgi:uroporphyrinogen decarboxylase